MSMANRWNLDDVMGRSHEFAVSPNYLLGLEPIESAVAVNTKRPASEETGRSGRSAEHSVGLITLYSNNSDNTGVTRERVGSWAELARGGGGSGVAVKPRVHHIARRLGIGACAEILQRYAAGETALALANEFGVSKAAVLNLLRENNVVMRRQPPTEEQRALLVRGYESGLTIAQLEEKYGIPHGSIGRVLKAEGVQMRPRGNVSRRSTGQATSSTP